MAEIEIARYQFHSWARKGIASAITEPDDLGDGSSALQERAQVTLPVALNGAGLTKDFALIGPGDIIGLNSNMIVRTQPLHLITDFEPNYLAFAEFYDEEFLWRYTPASPRGEKLRPWLFVLVLKEEEFERTKRRVPVPSITVKTADAFPPADETWLWAHVHNDSNIPDAALSDFEAWLARLNSNITTDPDQLYCRLLSPRKLEAGTAYFAFVVPAFETGRLAGLEQSTENVNAQMPSWSASGGGKEMPVYFEWHFKTGMNDDFESLVKKLEPRALDPRVGIRDMDCSDSGFVRADGTVGMPPTSPEILGLEGALKSPATISTIFPDPPAANEFQVELQKIVNLPMEPVTITGVDESGDPIISVPLYGNKHAKKRPDHVLKLDITQSSWLHQLNKDPRTRVAAGFGTTVIQKNQENYMRKAWSQVQTVLDANKRIKATVLYMKVALLYSKKIFTRVQSNVLLALSRPVLGRIMGSPTTLYQQVKESQLPSAVLSGAFRKLTAPARRVSRMSAGNKRLQYQSVVNGLNDGRLTAAPPKEVPGGAFTVQHIADKITPSALPQWMAQLIGNRNVIFIVLLVVFVVLAVITSLYGLFGALAAAAAAGYVYARRMASDRSSDAATAEQITDPQKQLESIAEIPQRPDFTLKLSDETNVPPPTVTSRTTDSVEAGNYRRALTQLTKTLALKAPEKVVIPFSLENAYAKVRQGIDPHRTFPFRLGSLVKFPGDIKLDEPEKIFPAMAYPDFDDPMYKKLTDISDELFVPNLKLIPNNTISLLETNPPFIESYMVGLNHEMGRELLWREFPTDERGSYFRQFWDVSGIISPSSSDGNVTASDSEQFKDIKPLHTWETGSALGNHNNRNVQAGEQVVLVIRGDLLKKYPNTIIFAQKAVSGDGDETKIELDLPDAEFAKKVKFPLFRAEVKPDIKFFGFDLTAEQALGTTATGTPADNLGWYFVIMQAPGMPAFGMDISFNQGDDGLSWDDLSWDRLPADTRFIKAGVSPSLDPPTETVQWGADAASMAYILFQKPAMVAVHARQMLAGLTT